MRFEFSDCKINFENNVLTLSNSKIERAISLENGIPASIYLKNVKTGYEFVACDDKKSVMFGVPGFDFASSRVSVYAYKDDREGFSDFAAVAEVHFDKDEASVRAYFRFYPQIGFINTSLSLDGLFGDEVKVNVCDEEYEGLIKAENDVSESVGFRNEHVKIHTTELKDFTDVNNNVVVKNTSLMYNTYTNTYKGQFFVMEDFEDESAFMLVKEAPCAYGRFCDSDFDAIFRKGLNAFVKGLGVDMTGEKFFTPDIQLYGATIGVGEKDELLSEYKKFYRKEWKDGNKGTFTMSNTWGDRNGDSRICEKFMLDEANSGGKIGVDIMQLDDGWQKGLTSNSRFVNRAKGEGVWGSGYYNSDEEFWKPAPKKFPSGFKKISDAIINEGAYVGLWFSPDFANDYENVERDIETVVSLYRDYNVKFFKIDGVNVVNSTIGTKLLHFVREVYRRTNGDVTLDMDITGNQKRWGYLFNKQYGNLFLENRYAKNGNCERSYSYFPYSTLRNLWQISEILPTQRFQIEVPNRLLGVGSYRKEDKFAPFNYTQDYLFAIAFFACPLLWTEMSNLDDEDAKALSEIVKVQKSIKKDLAFLDVKPLGQEPYGKEFSGFSALGEDGKGYVLLFRDHTKESEFEFVNCVSEEREIELMYSNFDVHGEKSGSNILFSAKNEGSFALFKVK